MPNPVEGPEITVCIVSARRHEQLDACLASLQDQVDAPNWELLVMSEGDEALPAVVHARFPDALVGLVDRAWPGSARNHLVERATGDLLLFLDDDVVVEPHLLRRVADVARAHPQHDVFGGPNVTPRGSTHFEVVQGAVLSSLLVTGPVRRRYGPHPAGEADERWFTLCNLVIRRAAMVPFADDLLCAEENGVLVEMARRGVRMWYDPDLRAFHDRRPSIATFARQMRKYGRGRGQLLRRDREAFHPAHLVPSALVTYLALLPVLTRRRRVAALPALVYAGAAAVAGANVARTLRRPGTAPLATFLTVLLHVAYGIGVIEGLTVRFRGPARSVPSWQTTPRP